MKYSRDIFLEIFYKDIYVDKFINFSDFEKQNLITLKLVICNHDFILILFIS